MLQRQRPDFHPPVSRTYQLPTGICSPSMLRTTITIPSALENMAQEHTIGLYYPIPRKGTKQSYDARKYPTFLSLSLSLSLSFSLSLSLSVFLSKISTTYTYLVASHAASNSQQAACSGPWHNTPQCCISHNLHMAQHENVKNSYCG